MQKSGILVKQQILYKQIKTKHPCKKKKLNTLTFKLMHKTNK